jgi:hypothetical protein
MATIDTELAFSSHLSLPEVSQFLSSVLCGGIPFVERETAISENFPTLYCEKELLGHDIFICKCGPNRYKLFVHSMNHYMSTLSPFEMEALHIVSVSDWLRIMFRGSPEINCE